MLLSRQQTSKVYAMPSSALLLSAGLDHGTYPSQVRTSCAHEANELMPDENTCSADCLKALQTCASP
jgi:hypothetical protein